MRRLIRAVLSVDPGGDFDALSRGRLENYRRIQRKRRRRIVLGRVFFTLVYLLWLLVCAACAGWMLRGAAIIA